MFFIGRIAVMALLATASVAHAYIGPGAGLSALGTVLALLGAALLLIIGFVWYPIKRLMARLKGKTAANATASAEQPTERPVTSSSESDASIKVPHESRPS